MATTCTTPRCDHSHKKTFFCDYDVMVYCKYVYHKHKHDYLEHHHHGYVNFERVYHGYEFNEHHLAHIWVLSTYQKN